MKGRESADVQSSVEKGIEPSKETLADLRCEKQSQSQSITELDNPDNELVHVTSACPAAYPILFFFGHCSHTIRRSAFDSIREFVSMPLLWTFVL